ncbi:MAG: hypothetical protein HYW28_09035 [Rhodospirillales bacterium]|nr:hypothetical protein [Rhodospirillales bacterium]
MTAARAFALQGDARIQREQQDEARARLELARQQEIDARNRAGAEQLARQQQQLETLRNDLRLADENRRFFRAQEDLRAFNDLDQRLLLADRQATENNLEARALRAFEDEAPPLPAREPVVGGQTADEIAAGLAVDPAEIDREIAFQALEDERAQRLAERRDAQRDAAIQQRIDLEIASDRISTAAPQPGLARGSIVDVFS